jgi:fatty-acyl-CoA synthase
MKKWANLADRDAIENEKSWQERNVPVSIYKLLSDTTDKFPDRDALSFQILSDPKSKAETLTWRQFHETVTQAANLFRDLGIGENDVVSYVLPNCTEAAVTLIAGATAGIANPVNALLDAEKIASILNDTKAKVVVTIKAFPKTDVAQKVAQAVAMAPNVTAVLEVDLLRYLSPPKSWIVPLIRPKNPVNHHARVLDFRAQIAAQPKTLQFSENTEDRVGAYFHTGGTTGMPKIVQHTHVGMIYNGWLGGRILFTETSNIMCPLPLFHVFACHVIFMAALASGAHVVFPTPAGYRGDGVFDNFWKLIERWKITFIITVPTAVAALMQRPVDADISSVKVAFSGSAAMPAELFKRFEKTSGVTIVEGYGLTEATCLVSCNPINGPQKIGSVGIPFPYSDVRILQCDGDGKVLKSCKTNEIGEICVTNPGVNTGHTYTEDKKNAGLYADGKYMRTGDLGRIDEDGFLWITGRAKDLIIRGGHNIDPNEIEEALAGHPAVAFVGAIGQPDDFAGELPCAYVELVDGGQVSLEELLAYAKEHIHERAAIPKYLEIVPELPKTAVGKIYKPDLRKMAITRVYNAALAQAGLSAKVVEVVEDKKRGLTARIAMAEASEEKALADVLGEFTRPWEFTDAAKAEPS